MGIVMIATRIVNIESNIQYLVMEKLGEFVRTRREQLGYKVARNFARDIGIDPSTLSRLERGELKTLPDVETINRLALHLEVPVIELIGAAGYFDFEKSVSINAEELFPLGSVRRRITELLGTMPLRRSQLEGFAELIQALGALNEKSMRESDEVPEDMEIYWLPNESPEKP
jgi:transcriptional regulator with XRE-family HTH domain